MPHYDHEPLLKDTVFDFATNVGDKASVFADKMVATAGGSATPLGRNQTAQETAPSLAHAFARAAFQSAELLSPEDPFGAALKRFGTAQERIGALRLSQDADAVAKFYQPLLNTLNEAVGNAQVRSFFF